MPSVEAAVRSHPGRIRNNNEDNFYLNGFFMRIEERNAGGLYKCRSDDKRQVYAVCDGMGGLNSGETASLLVVTGLGGLLSSRLRNLSRDLLTFIDDLSLALQSLSGEKQSAGSTIALIFLEGSSVRVAHLGDSRVYYKRGTLPLTCVTNDHSQAEWYAARGILTPDEAKTHQSRNTLRRFIGAPDTDGRTPDIMDSMRLKHGDVFMLCSDGLSNMVDTQEMDAEILNGLSCSDICKTLVIRALERGGDDNITAMMVRIV